MSGELPKERILAESLQLNRKYVDNLADRKLTDDKFKLICNLNIFLYNNYQPIQYFLY